MKFEELILRAKRGDEEALAELYARYSPAVTARLRGQLGPALRRRYDTEDLGQSVFAEVLGDLPRFQSNAEGAFRKWLTLKTQSKLYSKLRRNLDGSGRRREMTWDGDGALSADPAVAAADADERVKLARAMESLEAGEREVLRLRGENGLTYAEIAGRMNMPSADAARMRYTRALLRLKDRWPRA